MIPLGITLWLMSGAADAHLAVSTRSLSMLLADADLVIVAQPRAAPRAIMSSEDRRRPVVQVRVLDVLKGPRPEGDVRFVQQGHGVADYREGQVALLFLRRIERSRELASLADQVRWYSDQEHDDAYRMSPEERRTTVGLARAYLRATQGPPATRTAALRKVTVQMLSSGDPRLVESALHDLVRQPTVPLITKDELPQLRPVVRDGSLPIGSRLALLTQLQRRGLLDGTAEWVTLLRTTSSSDQRAVIRASKSQSNEAVTNTLIELVRQGSPSVAAESALALGRPGSDVAVPVLQEVAFNRPSSVGKAAVRSLGGIGTPEAREALSAIATFVDDESIRKRARAELRKLGDHSR